MKKLLIILVVFFLSFGVEKTYTVKLSERQVFTVERQIREVQNYLSNTNLPLQDYKALYSRLDSVWLIIYTQLPDSIKKK